jgi:hypothetical protein
LVARKPHSFRRTMLQHRNSLRQRANLIAPLGFRHVGRKVTVCKPMRRIN